MARQKKEDTGELLVSIEQFTRTRDSVIMSLTQLQNGLTHVQSGLNELLRAYMQHTASILAGGAEMAESLQLPTDLVAQAHASVEAAAQTAKNTLANAASAPEAGKKKRKRADKKERDPNAPKRPLTAAFLYAQQARPIVRKDLEDSLEPGQKMEPNAVNIEVNKRWSELSEEDKEKWKASYRESMEKYKEEYAIYRATKGDAAEALEADLHEEEELTDEAEAGALDSDMSTDSEDNAAADLAAAVTKAPSPPAADAKTPRPTKRQKTQAARVNGAANTPVPIAPAVAAHTPVPFPITNAQRAAQAANIPLPSSGAETPATSLAKEKKDKKKKEKPAPQPIAPAPAAKEPSPDDTKKNKKSGRTTRNTEAEAESPAVEKEKEPKAKKRDRSKRKSEGTAA